MNRDDERPPLAPDEVLLYYAGVAYVSRFSFDGRRTCPYCWEPYSAAWKACPVCAAPRP